MRGRRAGQRHHHRAALNHRLQVTLVVLAAVATAATFAPWGSSGERARTSHQLVEIADRAGIVSSSAAPLAAAWYLVPVLCGVVIVAMALRCARFAALVAATLGVLVATGAVLVSRSPLVLEPGAVVGGLAGGGTTLAATAVLVTARKAGRTDERPVGSQR